MVDARGMADAHHSQDQLRDAGKFAKADDEGRLPIDLKVPTNVAPSAELGVGGTAVFSGHLAHNEASAELVGRAKYRTFSDAIANISIIAAGVRLLLNLASNASWKAEPAKDSGEEGQEMADRVMSVLHDMKQPWHRIVRRLAGHRFFGFAVGEWVAKRNDDGSIGFANVLALPQITIERWMLDRNGDVLGVIQTSPQSARDVAIPREKIIHVVDDAINDSPEGLGLLRHVSDGVKRLQRLQELELFGFAGDLRGIPVGRAPIAELDQAVKRQVITKVQADALINGLEMFVKNHVRNPDMGVMLDSTPYKGVGENRTPVATPQWGVELLDGGSYSLDAVANAIIRIQREIARVLGVEHLLLGENSAASRSLSEDKTQSFGLLVDGTLREIREAVEQDLLVPLFELNGWSMDLMPTMKTEAQAFRNADQLSAVIRDLATAGVQVDRQDEAVGEIMDLLGLTRLAPLAEIDADLVLSSEDSQRLAMEIMGAKQEKAEEEEEEDNDSNSPAPKGAEDDKNSETMNNGKSSRVKK